MESIVDLWTEHIGQENKTLTRFGMINICTKWQSVKDGCKKVECTCREIIVCQFLCTIFNFLEYALGTRHRVLQYFLNYTHMVHSHSARLSKPTQQNENAVKTSTLNRPLDKIKCSKPKTTPERNIMQNQGAKTESTVTAMLYVTIQHYNNEFNPLSYLYKCIKKYLKLQTRHHSYGSELQLHPEVILVSVHLSSRKHRFCQMKSHG